MKTAKKRRYNLKIRSKIIKTGKKRVFKVEKRPINLRKTQKTALQIPDHTSRVIPVIKF